jgi:hypothetical protein
MGAGTMAWSLRAGQPTNALVINRAFATAAIFRINDRFFMALPPMTSCGEIATANGSVNAKKAS